MSSINLSFINDYCDNKTIVHDEQNTESHVDHSIEETSDSGEKKDSSLENITQTNNQEKTSFVSGWLEKSQNSNQTEGEKRGSASFSDNDEARTTKTREGSSRNIPSHTLMDYQGKYKLVLSDKYVYKPQNSKFKYQIYYKGQAINENESEKILNSKILDLKTGLFCCQIHSDCHYSRGFEKSKRYSSTFNTLALKKHVGKDMLTYLCTTCYQVFGRKDALNYHLQHHPKRRTLSSRAKKSKTSKPSGRKMIVEKE